MSQENVEVVRRWAAVIEGADPAAYGTMIDAIFASDAEMIEDPRWPASATISGPEAIRARFYEYVEGVDWRFTVEDALDAGNQVLVLIKGRERGYASGIEIKLEWACLLDFDHGQVTRWRWFLDRSEALKAAGLRE